MSRRFTMMLVAHPRSHARELGGPVVWVSALLFLFLCVIVIWSIGTTYVASFFGIGELARLDRENLALQAELQKVDLLAGEYQSHMAKLTDREKTVRLIVGLPDIYPDIRLVGIGGPVEGGTEGTFSDSVSLRVDTTLEKLDRLRRQAELGAASLTSIVQKAQKDQRYWRYMPTIKPTNGYDSSPYGLRKDPFTGLQRMHSGYDIAARKNEPVRATAAGNVLRIGIGKAYGRFIDIDHENGYVTRYAHLSSVLIKQHDHVKRGALIGHVGDTGRATGYHVHYEVRWQRRPLDPTAYFYPTDQVHD